MIKHVETRFQDSNAKKNSSIYDNNTLYPDSSPFCVSGGGGDQETSISVELRASVVMLIGGAVGAVINITNFR